MVFSRLCLHASFSCLLAFGPLTTHAFDKDQIKAGLESLMKMTPERGDPTTVHDSLPDLDQISAGLESLMKMTPERDDPTTVHDSLQDMDRRTDELINMFSESEVAKSRLDSIGQETITSASKVRGQQTAKKIDKIAKSEAEGVRSRPVSKEHKSKKTSKKTSASKKKVKDLDPELVKGLDLNEMIKGLDPELVPPIDELLKHKDPEKRDPAEMERMARRMLDKWKQKGYGINAVKSEDMGTSKDEEEEHARNEKEQRGTSGHDEL